MLFPKHVGIGHPIGAALVFGSAFVAQRKKKKKPEEGKEVEDESKAVPEAKAVGVRMFIGQISNFMCTT